MGIRKAESWRTLDAIEIALIKRMRLQNLPRDQIMSFFVRPGRVISPAALSELESVRPDIEPASVLDTQNYISRRIAETSRDVPYHGFGPLSELRSREILNLALEGQVALPGVKTHFSEFKAELPRERLSLAKSAKTMAAFANNLGGYIFYGVGDGGDLIGIDRGVRIESVLDALGDVVRKFTPFFQWSHSSMIVADKLLVVVYTFRADNRPVICSADFTNEMRDGDIYFRYVRSSRRIQAVDLHILLKERERFTQREAK